MEVLSQIGANLIEPSLNEHASLIQTTETNEVEAAFTYKGDLAEIPEMEEIDDVRFSEEYRKQKRKSRPLSKSMEGRIASGTTSSTDKAR